ncbi:hypothetical protein GIX45_29545 [Erwinia sp. CPCC 100877]|nr:hypothetical protein [Erwinia sp. CPCC 100877]
MNKKNIIAYYLPQFHEVEENNLWWGKGFTEWTALNNAIPYKKWQKIRKPTELGYYDLTCANVIEKQFSLANSYGVDAFCLWTYWFGDGEKILEKPLDIILENNINVKYCIAWANHSWKNKTKNILLKEQKYLGVNDYKKFFNYLLPHFKNNNYIKKNNKPIVTIFDPKSIPDLDVFVSLWNQLAKQEGFDGVFFIGDYTRSDSLHVDFFSAYLDSSKMFLKRNIVQKIRERLVRVHKYKFLGPVVYNYRKMICSLWNDNADDHREIPVIYPGWDTTIRHGKLGVVFKDFNMKAFEENIKSSFSFNENNDFVFIKSWNEWAEGNVMEPDDIYGKQCLELLRKHKNGY